MKAQEKTRTPHSLRFNVWLYFLLFSAVLVIMVWMFEVAAFRIYYQRMRQTEVRNIAYRLADLSDEISSWEEFRDAAELAAVSYGVAIIIYNAKGDVLASFGPFGGYVPDQATVETFLNKFIESGTDEVEYFVDRTDSDFRSYIYGCMLGPADSAFLYINMPITEYNIMGDILSNQLVTVGIISLAFALIMSWFISWKLSDPIHKMAAQAKKLGQGDYGVHFEGNGYDEIDELSNALNFATEELGKTDDLRKDLLANVSHDLRTPLSMIRAYAEMIRDLSGNDPEKRTRHTETIIEEADRLSLLVNDMLDLSKLQAKTVEFHYEVSCISLLAEHCLKQFSYLEERDGYRIEAEIRPDLYAKCDPVQIERVLYNLVINAVNYTGEDKRIRVTVEEESGCVVCSVIDNGPGIPPEEIDGIWKRYYRASQTRKRDVHGSGLGLSIVSSILDQHGAEYGVESTLNKGSRFYFKLKKTDPPGESDLPPAEPPTRQDRRASRRAAKAEDAREGRKED